MEKKILIVDDDEPVRDMLMSLFEGAGYKVKAAESAEAALAAVSSFGPQAMFFDLKLPGMSGLDLCREVRKSNSIAVIYAMTGYTSLFELSDCREAGFDDYFVKPVKSAVFIKAAEEAFEKLGRWKSKKS